MLHFSVETIFEIWLKHIYCVIWLPLPVFCISGNFEHNRAVSPMGSRLIGDWCLAAAACPEHIIPPSTLHIILVLVFCHCHCCEHSCCCCWHCCCCNFLSTPSHPNSMWISQKCSTGMWRYVRHNFLPMGRGPQPQILSGEYWATRKICKKCCQD